MNKEIIIYVKKFVHYVYFLYDNKEKKMLVLFLKTKT